MTPLKPALILPLLLLGAVTVAEAAQPAAAPASTATAAKPVTVEDGFRLLEARRLREAEAAFRAVLAADPKSIGAHEGLVYVYLATGETVKVKQEMDARLALAPKDTAWQQKRATILAQLAPPPAPVATAPADPLVLLPTQIRQTPQDVELRVQYARLLSFTPGRMDEAVKEYRAAVALAPKNIAARKGLAQALSWNNQSAEAAAIYDQLLLDAPNDLDLLIGRAQVARWNGDRPTAARLLDKAQTVSPNDARIAAEQSRLALDSGKRSVAVANARRALALAPDLPAAKEAQATIAAAIAPRYGAKLGITDDSSGFKSQSVAGRAELYPFADTRLRIEPAYTRYSDDLDSINRPSIGAGVRQTLPAGFQAGLAYKAYFPESVKATHEIGGELGWHSGALPISLAVGLRRRAIVDSPVGYEDVADFGGIGSGGSTVAGIQQRLQTNDKVAVFTAAPLTGMYVYGEFTTGRLSDDNQRESLAAGLGLDLFHYFDVLPKQSLTVKYDFYDLSYDNPSSLYFSPDQFRVHSPGVDWRNKITDATTVGLEAAVPIQTGASTGYLAGGFFTTQFTPKFSLEGRARIFDDTQFRVVSVVIGPRFSF